MAEEISVSDMGETKDEWEGGRCWCGTSQNHAGPVGRIYIHAFEDSDQARVRMNDRPYAVAIPPGRSREKNRS